MTAPPAVRLIAAGVFVFALAPARAAAQQTMESTVTERSRRSLSASLGFLFLDGAAGPGATAGIGYHLKALGGSKVLLSGIADFGGYRLDGEPVSSMMTGLRVTVLPHRRVVPYVQAGVGVVGRGGTPTGRPVVGFGAETAVRRCYKLQTEVQVYGTGITRLVIGISMPVREQ